jgi:hypothetical protein
MGQQRIVIIRLTAMTGSILAIFGLYQVTIGAANQEGLSVFETVHLQCVLFLVTLGYYCLYKLFTLACFPQYTTRQPDMPVTHVELAKEFIVTGRTLQHDPQLTVPRLTIWNVWILVYGLGFVFFVTGYCLLGLHPICLGFLGMSAGALCVDELICPRIPLKDCYAVGRGVVLAICIVALILVSVAPFDNLLAGYFRKIDVYSIFFAIIFPCCSQLILIVVRDSRHFTLGGVLEVCEFGFPFTAFLAVFHLSVAYGQRVQTDADEYQLQTTNSSYNFWSPMPGTNETQLVALNRIIAAADGSAILFYTISPAFIVPALVCYLSCVLEGSAVDPLLSLTFALAVQYLARGGGTLDLPLGVSAMILSVLALLTRIIGEYRPQLGRSEVYDIQAESTHLTQQVVWSRRREAAELLTSDLQQDPSEQQVVWNRQNGSSSAATHNA